MAEKSSEGVNYDEAILAQVESIQKEIADSCELVCDVEDVGVLSSEYQKDDTIYQLKIQDLKTKYAKLRRTRGDGNCFFRAFAFAYMERAISDPSNLKQFCSVLEQNKSALESLGYPSFTLEDFHDNFVETIQNIENKKTDADSLIKIFRDQSSADYLVCYLRIIVSGYLQTHADFYQNFIDDGRTVVEFCKTEVEPMTKESDHLHITALTSTLAVNIRVQYMDRGEGGKVNFHDFPDNGEPPYIHLLYRPGHYDILYV
ncbi:ubiquitin thioesterase OTUB1-like isoform X2 [Dysidea avara]|uniref:ubiquitin thioesterase OTUB1-like isoform X2 n=1 Tax=Dysidea avara TaxID=196820 RepID=UPI003330384B